ncbi:hypothetical protein [Schaalia sp.]|uniref:hypothetical protein n=1 Tax=Schaalia sp. TaxID=2691890 RepID=UPI003D12D47E
MKKMHVEYELADETTGTVRILAADKIAFEAFARSHGQPVEDGPKALTYMLFAALQRTGVVPTAADFSDFVTSTLLDLAPSQTAGDEENPTR